MDDLAPLRTPKKRQAGLKETPAPWQKGGPRQLSPFSPVGVRRRVSTRTDNKFEDGGAQNVDAQNIVGHEDAGYGHKLVLSTPRADGLDGEKAAQKKKVVGPTSSTGKDGRREPLRQRRRSEESLEELRLSSPQDTCHTRSATFNSLNPLLRRDIYAHQTINSRETVGAWSTNRATPADAEQMLCRFDVIPEYGPCCGISRKERWRLAEKLGLAPPKEVLEALIVSRKEMSIFDQRLAKFGVKAPNHG